jgi:hypothetical protein
MSKKYFKSKYGTIYEIFDYKDGSLYWKKNTTSRNTIGKLAGALDSKGYKQIRFDGKLTHEHRLIFFMFHGYCPECVDHIDGNKLNNRITNLREASSAENQYNTKIRTDNTSGVKGLNFHKDSNMWYVRVQKDGVRYDGGLFKNKDEAMAKAESLREKLHGEFARHK